MALDSYSNLKTAVADWLGRPGDATVTASVDDWIDLTEDRVHYGAGPPLPSEPVRVRGMETAVVLPVRGARDGGTAGGTADALTITVTGLTALAVGDVLSFTASATNTGAATLNPNSLGPNAIRKDAGRDALAAGDIIGGAVHYVYWDGTYYVLMPWPAVPLPTNYLGMRSIHEQNTPDRPLVLRDPATFQREYAYRTAGQPSAYTIEGDLLRFGPPPDGTRYYVLNYYRKLPALGASQETNWLLTNAPRVYLFGCLLAAAQQFGNEDGERWYAAYAAAVEGLRISDQRDRFPAGLAVRPGVRVV